jgi:hypothetical protein
MTAVIHGLAEVSAAFADAGPDATRELRGGLSKAAEPVARDAEGLALGQIRKMTSDWSEMRVGVLTRVVYVAPKKRGIRGDSPRKRPKFAPLLMARAMEPALQRNENRVVHTLQAALDRAVADFNRGGH